MTHPNECNDGKRLAASLDGSISPETSHVDVRSMSRGIATVGEIWRNEWSNTHLPRLRTDLCFHRGGAGVLYGTRVLTAYALSIVPGETKSRSEFQQRRLWVGRLWGQWRRWRIFLRTAPTVSGGVFELRSFDGSTVPATEW